MEEEDLQNDDDSDRGWSRRRLRKPQPRPRWNAQDYDYQINESDPEDSDIFDSQEIVDRLPEGHAELTALLTSVKSKLRTYKQQFVREQQ